VRAVAIIAVHNEERFVDAGLTHLFAQGVEAYLINNDSTDGTIDLARRHLGHGLIGIERLPRGDCFSWRPLLERKQELAATLPGDWFIHSDMDELRVAPSASLTLAQALAQVDREGYNAVNFFEFMFIPTRESPDHDHPRFPQTMRWYYPFLSSPLQQVRAWKRQPAPVNLIEFGGHRVSFPGRKIYPVVFPVRHYQFLSVPHAIRKYVERRFDPNEVAAGWHKSRAALRVEGIRLPSESELRPYASDDALDASNPRRRHFLFDADWAALQPRSAS